MVSVDADAIPSELKDRDQWLMWDKSADTPRRPHWRGNFGVSWSDPDDWRSFEEARKAAEERESWGIGYVAAADNDDEPRGIYGVIDIDGCTVDDHGSPKDWVPSLSPFADRDTYIEWSPSGSGLHIPVAGAQVPDWWKDVHFSEDEHEGVEFLTHKFCTFTGDTLRDAGDSVVGSGDWLEDWLIEAYKSITGEDPTERKSESFNSAREGGRARSDNELTEQDIRDALDHIDPDVTYATWRDIGFALDDYFTSDHTALSVFTDWSRAGSKWDDDAERQAERIIEDASSGGGRTIGTVVHLAQQNGWSYPAKKAAASTDGGTAAASSGPESGPSGVPDLSPWEVLRRAADDPVSPIGYNDEGELEATHRDLRDGEAAQYIWEILTERDDDETLGIDNGPLYSFHDGVWRQDEDGQRLREQAGEALQSAYTSNVKNELEERVRMFKCFDSDDLGAPDAKLATESGLLDLREREIEELRKDHYAIRKIPTEYDAGAECPRWLEFLDDSLRGEDDLKKLQEYAGYLLWHHAQPYGKAMFFVGPTDSGKGTALKALQSVIGTDNVASETLHDLISTRWGGAGLYGTMANIRNEITPGGLKNVNRFKELTGGEDRITAEFKGQDKFEFDVTQKFLFATNEIPTMERADEAFYNRCLFVKFPDTVPVEDQDPSLLDDLQDEASGILNWMLDGLERLNEQQRFTGELDVGGKKEMCNAFGGVIDRFVHNCVAVTGDEKDRAVKGELHELAQAYAESIDKDPEWNAQQGFTEKLKNEQGVGQGQTKAISDDGKNQKVFTGIRVNPQAIERLGVDVGTTEADEQRRDGGQQGLF